MRLWLLLALFLISLTASAGTQRVTVPDWHPPLATGAAPECPEHKGFRTYVSKIVTSHNVHASINGKTIRSGKGCEFHASLILTGSINRTIPLTNVEKQSFEIVDFSNDGQKLLLSATRGLFYDSYDYRDVELAVMDVPTGTPHWINAWKIFGWGNCGATVEPQGFTTGGEPLISARPSVVGTPTRPNCVSDPGLYKAALLQHAMRLPDDSKVPRYGTVTMEAVAPCRSDPDIIAACFTVHGRLSFSNGAPDMRIWVTGTKRILGVEDDPIAFTLPPELEKQMDWDVEASGNFQVCPLTKDRPGVMRMVCVDSADHVHVKSR